MVFQVECDELRPTHGIETTDTQFFARDALPFDNMHYNHVGRIVNVTLEYRQIVIFMYNYVHEAE
jgi:hypothetical protein